MLLVTFLFKTLLYALHKCNQPLGAYLAQDGLSLAITKNVGAWWTEIPVPGLHLLTLSPWTRHLSKECCLICKIGINYSSAPSPIFHVSK